MKRIELTQGKYALVDDADFDWLKQFKWCYSEGYAIRKENGKHVRMHRQILDAPVGVQVDHIDHDTLNNQRSNLRLATQQQNRWNRVKQRNNSSGIVGVAWNKQKCKWITYINVEGRKKYLGYFDSKADAMLAVDRAKRELHGEYASTNTQGNVIPYDVFQAL